MGGHSWRAAVAAVAVVCVTAGCGRNESLPDREAAGPAPPVWVDAACPDTLPGPLTIPPATKTPATKTPARGGIPGDFVPAWVLRCRGVPGTGGWSVIVTERAGAAPGSPGARLVALLRRPSDPPKGLCPAIAVHPPYVLLVDAGGRALLPAAPTDGCGLPRREVTDLLDSLPYRTLSRTRVRRPQVPTPDPSGCADAWKDLIALDLGHARPAPARPSWSGPVTSLRVCVYDRISGGDLPVGRLREGYLLRGTPASTLRAAFDAAGPADDCATAHTRFAVVQPPARSDWAVVELDGCRRLLRPDDTLGALDRDAVELITGH